MIQFVLRKTPVGQSGSMAGKPEWMKENQVTGKLGKNILYSSLFWVVNSRFPSCVSAFDLWFPCPKDFRTFFQCN